jgi:DNA mismatch endonuclease, patch repair protein
MPDVHTAEQRSRNMRAIKSSGNKTTEESFKKLLRQSKLTGWRSHPKKIYGKPDFSFPKRTLAIFLDGCFWHGCGIHQSSPKTNRDFWEKKIKHNKIRDKMVTKKLKREGWRVIRLWEHEIKKDADKAVSKILKALEV